jgi:hypothetical protein
LEIQDLFDQFFPRKILMVTEKCGNSGGKQLQENTTYRQKGKVTTP